LGQIVSERKVCDHGFAEHIAWQLRGPVRCETCGEIVAPAAPAPDPIAEHIRQSPFADLLDAPDASASVLTEDGRQFVAYLKNAEGGDATRAYEIIVSLSRELADARAKYEACKLQAQCHAMEARTANATIAEIYQVCTGATGEPGNWHGAEPVRAELARARDCIRHLLPMAKAWAHQHDVGQNQLIVNDAAAFLAGQA
jgi:hypothetical protein